MKSSSFLIAATNSGCGKTTITVGLLRAMQRRGIHVGAFKCGPDYIDTQYHQMAAGTESVNLDSRFASKEHLKQVFAHYAKTVNVVEGVMGLFDGYDRHFGSTAEIAAILNIPVVLVINARSIAYSAAAIIHGFKTFRTDIHIAGVIFNQVGSERHAVFLQQACRDTQTSCLGCIPRLDQLQMPSRHLGLSLENQQHIQQLIERAADAVEAHIPIETLLQETQRTRGKGQGTKDKEQASSSALRIAVARDPAFSFTYRENIDRLRQMGNVTFFSPLTDNTIPPDTDLLYLPGGYPEFHLPQLSSNHSMKQSIRNHIQQGRRCLAECGGMMYLCTAIIGIDGKSYPMTDILHQTATLQDMHLHLGYRQWKGHTTQGKAFVFQGHEFHFSRILEEDKETSQSPTPPIYTYKNLRASYIHLYWGDKNLLQLWE